MFLDDVKLLLAKEGLCETICTLLEKYKTCANTSEARALMKLACDIVVLILTGGNVFLDAKFIYLIRYLECIILKKFCFQLPIELSTFLF